MSTHRATATIDCGDPGPRVIDAGTERPVPTQPNPLSLHVFPEKNEIFKPLSLLRRWLVSPLTVRNQHLMMGV